MGPFLFIIFINDQSNYIEDASDIMYVDDTVLHVSHESKEKIENDVNQDMQNLLSYIRKNKLAIIVKREILKQCYSERLNVWQLQVKLMICLATKELIFHLNFRENFEKSYK